MVWLGNVGRYQPGCYTSGPELVICDLLHIWFTMTLKSWLNKLPYYQRGWCCLHVWEVTAHQAPRGEDQFGRLSLKIWNYIWLGSIATHGLSREQLNTTKNCCDAWMISNILTALNTCRQCFCLQDWLKSKNISFLPSLHSSAVALDNFSVFFCNFVSLWTLGISCYL